MTMKLLVGIGVIMFLLCLFIYLLIKFFAVSQIHFNSKSSYICITLVQSWAMRSLGPQRGLNFIEYFFSFFLKTKGNATEVSSVFYYFSCFVYLYRRVINIVTPMDPQTDWYVAAQKNGVPSEKQFDSNPQIPHFLEGLLKVRPIPEIM